MDDKVERKKWSDLLETINQLEIKGMGNVVLMYRIMSFITNEISEMDKQIKNQGG